MRRITTRKDPTVDRQQAVQQREMQRVADRGNGCPFMAGILRSVQLLAGVDKTVDHGLGTRSTFIVVRPNYDGSAAPARIVESTLAMQTEIDPNHQLSVVADVDCVVDLWFYAIASESVPR